MNHSEINSDLHEIKQHGDYSFPYMIYHGKMPEYQYSYPLHWHEEMEIIYVISGVFTTTVNYISYELHKGDILLIRPHDIHSITQYKGLSCEYFNILFRLSLLEDKVSNLDYERYFKPLIEHKKKLPTHIKSTDSLAKILKQHIKELITNRHNSIFNYQLMIKAKLFTIMYYIEQYTLPDNDIHNIESDNKLKEILTYINENYSSSITIDDISEKCHYSKSYFMKFFKKQTGNSFIQYLNNYRLEIASKLLIESNKKITDIALLVGFDNIPYFIRSFNKKYKMSPSNFRKTKSKIK